jgi:sugar/nucleoside kinase (ribokinase family)
MSATWDVLGFGAVAVDDLVYLDGYPAPDSKMPVVEEQREGGGLAGTALVAAARLGARVAYAGILGDDELSRFTIEAFEREGVDCSLVRRQLGARPTHSTILVDRTTGHRTILHSSAGVVVPTPGSFSNEVICSCRVLFVDNTIATFALEATRIAQAQGIPVVADIERLPEPKVLALLAAVDHLIVGTEFGSKVTGEHEPAAMVRALRRPGQAACIVTAGAQGCWYATQESGDELHHVPACTVQVMDTTGCGDVFHGAYAASLARGEDVARAVAVATVAAGLKATQPGGRRGIPDRATVERYLAEKRACSW